MTTLLNIAVINAVTVLPLALLAVLFSRLVRNAAFTHVLWVIVLLKFVTPPLFNLPVTIDVPAAVEQVAVDAATEPLPALEANRTVPRSQVSVRPDASVAQSSPRVETPAAAVEPIQMSPATQSLWATCSTACGHAFNFAIVWWARNPAYQWFLLACWIIGTAAWTTLQVIRAVRFSRRVVSDAATCDQLQDETNQLASNLGMKNGPRVLTVNAAVSPMLWGCGQRAVLLFPADLASQLNETARATLLTHELAHFVRGDHWVRLLELIATALFWWHPVVWWARNKIEESEEECCDAWVVSQFPHAPRRYAEALLDTIDYLCDSRLALPPVASGLGQAAFLRRRLVKIMQGTAPKPMSQKIRYLIALLALVLLPLQPFVFASANISRSRPVIAERIEADPTSTSSQPIEVQNHDPAESPTSEVPEVVVKEPVSEEPTSSPAPRAIRGEKVWSTAVSQDGRYIIRTTTARRVTLTDRKNRVIDLSNHNITAVAFAADGESFVAAGSDGRITLWSAKSGELIRTVATHGAGLRSIAVTPQGDTVAAGGRDGAVLLYDLATDQPLATIPNYASSVNCVRFSPSGRQIAVAIGDWMSSNRSEVVILETATGRPVMTLNCETTPGAVAFASNDELIVGLWDGDAQLWNLINRQVVGTATANKNVVAAAAFSPDNPVLREVTFVASEQNAPATDSPLSVLRGLFGNLP